MKLTRNQRLLRKLFNYNQLTGKLYHAQGTREGREVGCLNYAGYRVTSIKKKNYRVPRLIWLWMTGYWPKGTTDHKDRNRDNNRWDNLRDASHEEQSFNKDAYGAWERLTGWETAVQYNGKRYWLGTFATRQLAREAYEAKRTQLVRGGT